MFDVRSHMFLPRNERSLRAHRPLAGAEATHRSGLGCRDLRTRLEQRGGRFSPDDPRTLYRPEYRRWRLRPFGSLARSGCAGAIGRNLRSQHERHPGGARAKAGPDGILDSQGYLLGRSTPDTRGVAAGAVLRTNGGVECGGLRSGAGLPGRTERGCNLAGSDRTLPSTAGAESPGAVVFAGWGAVSGRGCGAGHANGPVPAAPALDAGAGTASAEARARSEAGAGKRARNAQRLRDS